MNKAILIVSGGMDSVTLAYHYATKGYELSILSFDYGQRHKKELGFAKDCAAKLGARWDLVDLGTITKLIPGSSLVDPSIPTPNGHYAEESMKTTVVPNRNAIMLSIAWANAVAIEAEIVAIGAHAGDHFIYPDCRPGFFAELQVAFHYGNKGFGRRDLHLETPFINWNKARIVSYGSRLGIPFEQTWSCYRGGELHCGKCGTCIERIEAFKESGIVDPTIYEA